MSFSRPSVYGLGLLIRVGRITNLISPWTANADVGNKRLRMANRDITVSRGIAVAISIEGRVTTGLTRVWWSFAM